MIGLAFDEVDEEIGILGGQGEELVEERLLGLQLLAERPARVAVHEYVQESAGPARRGEHGNRRGAAPRSMLEIQTSELLDLQLINSMGYKYPPNSLP
jgi:hypothetical protein